MSIDDFWNYVISKTPPYMPSSNERREVDYMLSASMAGIFKSMMTDDDLSRACVSYLAAQRDLKAAQNIADSLKVNVLIALGGESQKKLDSFNIRLKEITSRRFDSRRFKEDYPQLYSQYLTESSYTQLTIKEEL